MYFILYTAKKKLQLHYVATLFEFFFLIELQWIKNIVLVSSIQLSDLVIFFHIIFCYRLL